MGYDAFDRLCKAKGVTAYQVAKATGVSTSTLSSWKSNKYVPKDAKLQRLAAYFKVSPDYFRDDRGDKYKDAASKIHSDIELRSALGITGDEWEMISIFRYLNDTGKSVALSRMAELTEIERYRDSEHTDAFIRF